MHWLTAVSYQWWWQHWRRWMAVTKNFRLSCQNPSKSPQSLLQFDHNIRQSHMYGLGTTRHIFQRAWPSVPRICQIQDSFSCNHRRRASMLCLDALAITSGAQAVIISLTFSRWESIRHQISYKSLKKNCRSQSVHHPPHSQSMLRIIWLRTWLAEISSEIESQRSILI